MAEAAKQPKDKPVRMKRVRMTFGDGEVVGILVQTVTIFHNIMGNGKWYGDFFRVIAPRPILDAFINVCHNLDNILLAGEDGSRYRINGVKIRFRESIVSAQDMSICEDLSLDIDEVIPLEKGPTHYESYQEQKVVEASSVSEAPEDPAGSKAAEGVGGKAGQDQGEDPVRRQAVPGDFMC